MLKACSRCGKIHQRGYKCTAGITIKQQRNSQADKFRNTQLWKRKAKSIKKRDMQMCRICFEKLYNTILQYNATDTSVHHIIPLAEDYDKRLDDDNLITLCSYHHELAESGLIPRAFLLGLAAEPFTLYRDKVKHTPPPPANS